MLSDERLAEIEAQHTPDDNPAYCTYDHERMPCDTLRLVAEVRRLRAEAEDIEDRIRYAYESDDREYADG